MSEKTRAWLAFLSICLVLVFVSALFFVPLPEGAKELICTALGVVLAGYKDIYSYYFGSSDSSQYKTDLLNERQQQATGKPDDPIHVEPTEPQ